jgi:hypothetical protein
VDSHAGGGKRRWLGLDRRGDVKLQRRDMTKRETRGRKVRFLGEELFKDCLTAFRLVSLSWVESND